MDKVPVRLRISMVASWRFDHTLVVYTDQGSGTLDMDNPLLQRPLRVFGMKPEPRGFLSTPFLSGRFLSGEPVSPGRGGFLEWPWLGDPNGFLGGGEFVEVTVHVRQGFGVYKFAAEAIDGAGNKQGGGLAEFTQLVSGEQPPPPETFVWDSFDVGAGDVVFGVV